MRGWKCPHNRLQQEVDHGDDFDELEGTEVPYGWRTRRVIVVRPNL
jgi:hypothetical protein